MVFWAKNKRMAMKKLKGMQRKNPHYKRFKGVALLNDKTKNTRKRKRWVVQF